MSSVIAKRPPLRGGGSSRRRSPAALPGMDEHDLYPVHEEDNVPEKGLHEALARYLKGALAAYLPDKWVTGDVCMYWEERNFNQYAAPDVLVIDAPRPRPIPSTYLRWLDPPPLLVAEIGSRSTFVADEGPKLDTYGFLLAVPEYLYYHPDRRDLRLYRWGEQGYQVMPADARGWVHSETLDLWFGVDEDGWLRAYTPAGEPLLSHEETERARQEEARARHEAERARQEEGHARQRAEVRAAAAERRLAEMEAELQRLRGRGDAEGAA